MHCERQKNFINHKSEALQEAITTALKYDNEVIFEPALVEVSL